MLPAGHRRITPFDGERHASILTLLMATLAGAAAGLVTGLIRMQCRVRDLLSGIITMTGLYSINLRIAGRANLPFFNMDTLFDNALVDSPPQRSAPWSRRWWCWSSCW